MNLFVISLKTFENRIQEKVDKNPCVDQFQISQLKPETKTHLWRENQRWFVRQFDFNYQWDWRSIQSFTNLSFHVFYFIFSFFCAYFVFLDMQLASVTFQFLFGFVIIIFFQPSYEQLDSFPFKVLFSKIFSIKYLNLQIYIIHTYTKLEKI